MPRDLRIVVPVSGIARGKSRLASALPSSERARLNGRLLDHALAVALGVSDWPDRCLVISPCARVLAAARAVGARPLAQARPLRGLNAAIRQAVRALLREGARRVLVMPVDLPLASARAVAPLLAYARAGAQWVIVPDREGAGTNVLVMPARIDIGPRFGADSFRQHVGAARAAGRPAVVVKSSPLMQDLDRPEHLATWIAGGRRFD
jgi:2-phospho-L-lactate guanylyltransferase